MEEVVEYFSWSSGKYDQVKLKPLQTREIERERKNDGNSEFKNAKTVMRLLVLLTVSIS